MRLRISIRGCVSPSVRPSVHPSRVIYKQRIWPFEGKKSSSDIKSNDTMSDDEVQSHLMHHRCPFFLHSFVHTLGPMGSPMTFVIALIIQFESFIKNYLSWFHSHRFKLFRSSCRWLQAGFFLKISEIPPPSNPTVGETNSHHF